MRSIGVSLEFSSELLVSLEVTECVGVFDVSDEGMILAHLDIVVSELILVMLVLRALYLVLVRVLRVLVEVRLSLAIDADPEKFTTVVIRS
jgi:hypothetical protein